MAKRFVETVEKTKTKFLWYPFVPFGVPSVFQGQSGYGKTTIVCRIMAEVSRGIYPPRLIHGAIKDRSEMTEWESYAIDCVVSQGHNTEISVNNVEMIVHNETVIEGVDNEDIEETAQHAPAMNHPFMRPIGDPLKIVYISRENPYGVIREKYELFGGKEGSLLIEDESDEKFTTNIDKIRNLVGDAGFVVVDPIFPFIEGSLASNDAVAIMMHNFEVVAQETGAAILLLNNLRKDGTTDYDSGLGASNLKNISRSLFKIDQMKPFHYIESVKNNLAPAHGKIAVLMDDVGRVDFMNVDRLKSIVKPTTEKKTVGRPSSKIAESIEFLHDLLKDGPLSSDTVFSNAMNAGISIRTLNRAKAAAGVESVRVDGNNSVWIWKDV